MYAVSKILIAFVALGFCEASFAGSDTSFADPNHGASPFDWQTSWGTIHMNSDADGLMDPGQPTTTARMPCVPGAKGAPNVCDQGAGLDLLKKVNLTKTLGAGQVGNGIKFDIKNSVLNCMSKVLPNAPIFNGGDASIYAAYQCKAAGLTKRDASPRASTTQHPYSLVYLPLWEKKGTDASSNGCQRQIVNDCVQDIYDCGIGDDAKSDGTKYPLAHAFTQDEVKDLGGSGPIPTTYWRYKPVATVKGIGNTLIKTSTPAPDQRWVLSKTDPGVSGAERIDVGPDSNLARIKAFKVDLAGSLKGADVSGFYIVDPSEFFDMNLYVKGGKYDSGYVWPIDPKSGQKMAEEACPIRGFGYNGICDPNGKDGCNLPVYGIGPSTTFTAASGKSSSIDQYPLKWSGYVKSWRVISKAQYLANTSGIVGPHGGSLYATEYDNDVIDGPVIMVLRGNDYCDPRELKANNGQCIQYKQYQALKRENGAKIYTFVDLFMPSEDLDITNKISKMAKTDVNKDGSAIGPSLSGASVGPDGKPIASFVDPYMPKDREGKDVVQKGATWKGSDGEYGMGDQIKDASGKVMPGARIKVSAGTSLGLRNLLDKDLVAVDDKHHPNYSYGDLLKKDANGKPIVNPRCAMVKRDPSTSPSKDLFVPTGKPDEYRSFLNAAAKGDTVDGVSAANCDPMFESAELVMAGGPLQPPPPNKQLPPKFVNPNGLKTWIGTLSCDDLVVKPSCNETKIITAQRYCMLSDGVQSSCGDCAGIKDPDALVIDPKTKKKTGADFSLKTVQGSSVAAELMDWPNPDDADTMCYFRAACFASASAGCPAPGTSGGHIFCLSADTKISMADGSRKEIINIKAGEKVLSFNAEQPKARLKPAVVKSVAVTEGQRVMWISLGAAGNVLKITPEHKVLLSSGRSVMARDLKEGDELVNSKAKVAVVSDVHFVDDSITVYNLVLEDGADGYVANGIRVQSYPSNSATGN